MGQIKVEQSTELTSSPSRVWPLIIDTDRMNRLMGMAPVHYRPVPTSTTSPARYIGTTRMAGMSVEYEEQPFKWTFEKEFRVHRVCSKGPLKFIAMHWTLEPGDPAKGGHAGGTKLTVSFESEGANRLWQPIAYVGAVATVRRVLSLGKEIDAHVRDHAPSPFVNPVAPSDPDALSRGIARLKKQAVRPELVDRLGSFVRDASDADVRSIRAFDLADEWGEPRRDTLAAMLHGVPAGLFELRWSILCPSCRTTSSELQSLDQVGLEGHCQLCDISFELDLDQAVEATFHPHPDVRQIEDAMFCIAGPARTPHVLSQNTIEAKSTADLEVPSAPGRYRVFSRGGGRATVALDPAAPLSVDVRVNGARLEPADLVVAPAGHLHVINEDDVGTHVKVERLEYASRASTAHFVSTMDEFRGVFGADLLKRKTPLKVARVSLLFSDLTGSTALYALVGDAAAFRFVDDHFDVLREVITKYEGSVVKTMGDAIMASFTSDAACVRASHECLARFEEFRSKHKHGDKTHIKLGLYSGPCYVISANATTDYFGQTVNVASRLQHLAQSGEVVMLAEEAGHLDMQRARVSERETVRVKGVDHDLEVVRVTMM